MIRQNSEGAPSGDDTGRGRRILVGWNEDMTVPIAAGDENGTPQKEEK